MFANPFQTHESLFNRTSVNFERLNIHPTPSEKKKKNVYQVLHEK